MADFRKMLPALAVLALVLGSAMTLSAQAPPPALTCTANAGVPPLLRAEGITELAGDLLLNCTGGTPTGAGQAIPQVNIQIFLNTTVTSKILNSPLSEALLFLDDPSPATQSPCYATTCGGLGDGAGGGQGTPSYYGTGAQPVAIATGSAPAANPYSAMNNRNVFQGQVVGTNSVLWLGVPIDPPGTTRTRIIRITNVRANTSALGVASGNAPPTPLIAVISATGTTSLPINNPQQTIGFVQRGLNFSVRNVANDASISSPATLQQCVSQSLAATITQVATLRFSENFATGFKKRNAALVSGGLPGAVVAQNVLGSIYNTETGFYNPTFATTNSINNAGLADIGTRLKATFNNVPSGVTIYTSLINSNTAYAGTPNTPYARLTSSEAGSFSAVSANSTVTTPATGVAAVTTTNGTGTAVWEVLDDNPLASGSMDFAVYVSYTASPGTGSPALGTATVNGSYAPISTVTSATSSDAVPRFADTSTATSFLSLNACVTNLLFPFVTNQAGFDTGLAISNTSTDPWGTGTQSGTCTLNGYGANAPAAITTASVATGTTFAALASSAMPNFQGYVIAVCRFQYAHGFAFVSDFGARNLAMGYLGLVIPDRTRTPSPFSTGGTGVGEVLGN